ncbi:hybrid sensor histidine kinase/response regulator transcription factor [Tenacibaculum xiamenense]|uniref:hybrid sensor histidine kinase/response regulator transcription factor n=1 Tax=Tenacibaculum xiamenense TaxID=1261553 RepID=UPI0038B656C0
MRSLHIFYAITIFISVVNCALAQNYTSFNVKHFDTNSGLSNDWVSDITQDKDGYIWFATQYGLNRFDGKKFKPYIYIPGDSLAIKANWVRSIVQLNDKIYVGTYGGGVDEFDLYKETFSSLKIVGPEEKEAVIIHKLLKLDSEQLLISSSNGVYSFDPKKRNSTLKFSKRVSNIQRVENEVLVSKSEELSLLESNRLHFIHKLNSNVVSFNKISEDTYVVCSENELYLLKRNKENWFKEAIKFNGNYKTLFNSKPFIYKDKNKGFWINGGDRLYRFSDDFKDSTVYNIKELLEVKLEETLRLNCMFQDREGSYWLGTNRGVFQLIAHKPFRHSYLNNVGAVREIAETDGKIWFSNNKGLFVWDKINNVKRKLSGQQFRSFCIASDQYLYAFGKTESNVPAIFKINPQTESIEYIENENLRRFSDWKILEDNSNRLWISQWGSITILDLKSNEFKNIPILKKSNIGIIDMLLDKNDNLWLATSGGGLYKIKNVSDIIDNNFEISKYQYNLRDNNSISSNIVQALHEDVDQNIWVGTDGGLNLYDDTKDNFTRFIRDESMVSDKIYGITSDKNSGLWLSTASAGIINYKNGKFIGYTQEDGLFGNGMLIGSIYKNKDGFIWIGGENGLHYFHPDDFKPVEKEKQNLVLESYKKYKKDTLEEFNFPCKNGINTFRVAPEDHIVSFEFKTLTYEKSEDVRYSFFLEGYHKNWLPPQSNGVLTLSNLSKGDYKLKVKSFQKDNRWIIEYPSIPVTVIPFWYYSNTALFIYGLLLLLLAYTLYNLQLQKRLAKKENELTKELSESKNKWFHRIAHEFRSPLTVIFNAIHQLKIASGNSDTFQNKHLTSIHNQSSYLSNQVEQILEIAKIQDNRMSTHITDFDFISFIKNMVHSFGSLAEDKNMKITLTSSHDSLWIATDEDKWRKIITNLISNAIKYTPEKGEIHVNVQYFDKLRRLLVSIKDTGKGMSKEFMKEVFNPFTKEDIESSVGVGLGLTLTKELVNLLAGEINVISDKNHGTEFIITMGNIENLTTPLHIDEVVTDQTEENLSTVLIAEDHGEIRKYLELSLQPYYNVISCENGKKAWKQCEKHIPDIVISDVAMPELDGIELAEKIKGTEITSHIPLILLTGKSSKKDQLKGLKVGAEAYVTKPFDNDELLIRVSNLLNLRKKLQLKYQQNIHSKSENELINTFVSKVLLSVKENIHDENFGVPELAETMNFNRVQLYRKLKNLTGYSPSMYIRKVKIDTAKELLKQKDITIAEIAYSLGFKDPSYFSKVFTEEVNKTPSEYKEQL